MSSEIHASKDTMNVIESNLDTAGYKQKRLNSRGMNFLEGKYRQQAWKWRVVGSRVEYVVKKSRIVMCLTTLCYSIRYSKQRIVMLRKTRVDASISRF